MQSKIGKDNGLALGLLLALVIAGATRADIQPGKPHGRVVLKSFPEEPASYQEDVRALRDEIRKRHGPEEWELVVLASEFHRHLGIYSIIGVKMGLRAREHFKADLDELVVTSYAGSQPPVSCLSDGLQVSTGATLGHGTIMLAAAMPAQPKAHFYHDGQKISLQLKHELWQQIRRDIATIIQQHGPPSGAAYWIAVRELGLRYWKDWSRREIFDLEPVPTPGTP